MGMCIIMHMCICTCIYLYMCVHECVLICVCLCVCMFELVGLWLVPKNPQIQIDHICKHVFECRNTLIIYIDTCVMCMHTLANHNSAFLLNEKTLRSPRMAVKTASLLLQRVCALLFLLL